jgi:hypothetical protein
MTFSKMTMVGTAVTFLSLIGVANAEEEKTTDANQEEIQAILTKFEGLKKCDGSERAENVCKKHCTGAGTLYGAGNCSHQEVWEKCAATCQAGWIKPCIETATNSTNNLKGTASCK